MTYFIVLVAVLTRLAPHPPNFSPTYAGLLLSGACLKKRDSIWFPLMLLAASDFILNKWVYHVGVPLGWGELLDLSAYAVLAMIGWWLRHRISVRNVITASLAGPTAFFLISNFGVWFGWRMYPATWEGLLACYLAALPFYGNSLLSGLLFSGLLFGGREIYRRKIADPVVSHSFPRAGM